MKKPIAAALMVAFFSSAHAETFDQIVYDNPDYTIVLTVKPCKVDPKHFPYGMVFEYEGTAFDNNGVTKTCWNKEGDFYNVWFHEEVMVTIGSYREHLFKPVKPTL
jgi:5'-3' exonuclease